METHDLDKTYGFIKWKDSRTSYDPNEISSKTQIPKNKNSNTKISRILHKIENRCSSTILNKTHRLKWINKHSNHIKNTKTTRQLGIKMNN